MTIMNRLNFNISSHVDNRFPFFSCIVSV